MIKRFAKLVLASMVLLTACSGKEAEPEQKTGHKELYRDVNAPLEKAKNVEQQLQESAEEQKRQLDP